MTKEYTEQQLEEAKKYLRDRLDAELSMERDIDSILTEYTPVIISLLMKGATRADLDDLINEIVDRILDDCFVLSVDERTERRDSILAYMNLPRDGMNLEERIKERCETLYNELNAAAIVGEALDLNEKSVVSSVLANFDDPFDNEIFKAARTKIQRGELELEIEYVEEPHYGRGRDVSSSKALKSITGYAIADAWMWDLFDNNKNKKGYYVFRGSGYPCQTCDEAVLSGFHPISDTSHLVPLHPHCKCFVVFI